MADPTPNPDTGDDTRVRPPTPRWVKVFGIIGIVVVLLVVAVLLFGGGPGGHGPGRHTPSIEYGVQQP
ncbi:MAG: hypothetical protein HY725_21745 [Candidatus Rokubacteria bacterium]|nr:hypothetical protein [Candidatus Rokubacteria bacterium]